MGLVSQLSKWPLNLKFFPFAEDLEELLHPKDTNKIITVKHEDAIIEALLNWILFDKNSRIEFIERICQLVKWSQVSENCRNHFEISFPAIKG